MLGMLTGPTSLPLIVSVLSVAFTISITPEIQYVSAIVHFFSMRKSIR